MCFLAEGFTLCLQSAYGISCWKQRPWSLSVHSADRGQAGSRCKREQMKKSPTFGEKSMETLPDFKLIYISSDKSYSLVWFPAGVGPQLASLSAVANNVQTSEVEFCGGSVGVQHFSTLFWLGTFSESLSYRKRKVTRDG